MGAHFYYSSTGTYHNWIITEKSGTRWVRGLVATTNGGGVQYFGAFGPINIYAKGEFGTITLDDSHHKATVAVSTQSVAITMIFIYPCTVTSTV